MAAGVVEKLPDGETTYPPWGLPGGGAVDGGGKDNGSV